MLADLQHFHRKEERVSRIVQMILDLESAAGRSSGSIDKQRAQVSTATTPEIESARGQSPDIPLPPVVRTSQRTANRMPQARSSVIRSSEDHGPQQLDLPLKV
jgi:hypothetical protein